MRTPAEAEKRLQSDIGRDDLLKVLSKAKERLDKRHCALPLSAECVLGALREGSVAVEDLTRLALFSNPCIPPNEILEVKTIVAKMLWRAFGTDTRILMEHGIWDIHVSDMRDYFMPEMAASGLFDAVRSGGNLLFLAGGIGEEALVLRKTLELPRIHASILEKDPRYALVSRMRGFSLINNRPTSLDEDWGSGIAGSVDFAFLTFPDTGFDFLHIASNMDRAIKAGGHAIIIGNLDFAGELTGYFSARYQRLENPLRDGSQVHTEFLQIFQK